MTQMNLPMKQEQTHRHREQTCGCRGDCGVSEVWTEGLGLAHGNCLIEWVNNKVLLYSTGN